jgi:hypothetical protein
MTTVGELLPFTLIQHNLLTTFLSSGLFPSVGVRIDPIQLHLAMESLAIQSRLFRCG